MLFDSSDIVFIEAYFLTDRFDTAKYLVEFCKTKGKLLVFNLCGDNIFSVIPEPIKYLVRHAHIIFGNKVEYTALAALLNFDFLENMISDVIHEDTNEKYRKTLVITDGPQEVLCYSKNEIIKLTPPKINQCEVKDTTAAGDAFIGGFLAGVCRSHDIRECINIGFYAASNIIKQRGCSLPNFHSKICTDSSS